MRAMTIRVSLHSDRSATVTLRPHWLATLLLGRMERTRNVWRYAIMGREEWRYLDDNHAVPERVAAELERAAAIVAVGARMLEHLRR